MRETYGPPLERIDVARALGVSVDTLDRLIARGEFPDAFDITDRTKGWLQKDVDAYLHLRSRGTKPGKNPPAAKGGNET